MEIKLHFMPEKPNESCEVIVFEAGNDGNLSFVTGTGYSTYWDSFYARDNSDSLSRYAKESNKRIIAWAYFNEVSEEFKNENVG